MQRITIDPADFGESAWVELYNACMLMPRTYEKHHKAKAFRRGKGQIETAIICCRNKAERIRAGGLGPVDAEAKDWAFDLDAAAEQLELYLNVKGKK